ncbi:DUF3016 domain-containing protein [Pseudoduganella namucuonensis]|uniref:DUF3016 domain-containing protein n=1 Tax=Pseudoduganella namucuonensis TaxID=1035707 RepID=A0A1I7K7T5_9BURK|nr:DUF3016 domain-containing protein [Pseudoduganella namucuonensis]SFU93497.1 Protein of unknown function [Pseudoduganella namucuonensis]
MNKLILQAAMALAFTAASGYACAGATVTYVNPDKMTDVPRFNSELESMEALFREHVDKLAAKLPAGQELKVEFLDIDLAGDVFPRVPVQDVRIMRGRADWPRIHLRYSVEQDGKVLRSGERRLADAAYLMGYNHYNNELYGHEKQMLDDWFRKDVLAAR